MSSKTPPDLSYNRTNSSSLKTTRMSGSTPADKIVDRDEIRSSPRKPTVIEESSDEDVEPTLKKGYAFSPTGEIIKSDSGPRTSPKKEIIVKNDEEDIIIKSNSTRSPSPQKSLRSSPREKIIIEDSDEEVIIKKPNHKSLPSRPTKTPRSVIMEESSSSSEDDNLARHYNTARSSSARSSARLSMTPRSSSKIIIDDDGEEIIITPKKSSVRTMHKTIKPSGINPFDDNMEEIKTSFLVQAGYIPIDNLVQNNSSSRSQELVITKAYNPNGEIVLITPEKQSTTVLSSNRKTVVKEIKALSIPKSYIEKVSECAGNSACSIGMQCKGEYCFMNRSDDGKVSTKNYSVISGGSDSDNISKINTPFAYPLISVEEIKTSPEAINARVTKITASIRENTTETLNKCLDNCIKNTEELMTKLRDIKSKYDAMENAKNIERNDRLAKINAGRGLSSKTPAQEEASKIIYEGLVTVTETEEQMNTAVSVLTQWLEGVLSEAVEKASDVKSDLFVRTKTAFDEGYVSSAILMNASGWGLPEEINSVSPEKLETGDFTVKDSDNKELTSLKRVTTPK